MRTFAGLVAGGLALAACSGGSTTAPAPTPGATPTPTPTPAAYPRVADQTGNQRYDAVCATLLSNNAPPVPAPNAPLGTAFVVDYRATSDSWTLTGSGVPAVTFGPVDRDPRAPAGTVGYARTVDGASQRLVLGVPMPGGRALDYARGLVLVLREGQYRCVYGVPTRTADVPAAAFEYARVAVAGTAFTTSVSGGGLQGYSLEGATATLRLDAPANRVLLTLRLVATAQGPGGPAATPTDLGTYTASVPVDRVAGIYGGALASADREVQASNFGGWFFGPNAGESAAALSILAFEPATGRRISALLNVTAGR